MYMTPARFIKAIMFVAALLLAAGADAQVLNQAPTPAASGSRLNWPRTFAGQPDFEFSRSEVIEDSAKQNKGKPLAVPVLSDLLEDVPLDPLRLTQVAVGPSGTTVSGTADDGGNVQYGPSGEPLTSSTLPALNVPESLDLREFRSGMAQRLAEYMQNWHPDLRTFELSYLLRGLALNGVMTSPERRAIINGTTYAVGDQIKATVTIAPSDPELIAVLEDQLPAEGTVTKEQAQAYFDVYEQTVATLAAQRKTNPGQYQRTFTLPVTVRAIQSRKVTLEFNGVTYDLAIPFAM
ncbi:MAG TPA: hypothetical protein VHP58_04795 [Alphaproteobacteria bacterium]|nr:hypothetical protein [Alphaproteobacteria bacterium]